jgi:hypothetical protein
MIEIDNFFKEKQESFTIDDSKKNMHWQQMQQLVAKKQRNTKTKTLVVCVGIFAVFLTLQIWNRPAAKKVYTEKQTAVNSVIEQPAEPTNEAINKNTINDNKLENTKSEAAKTAVTATKAENSTKQLQPNFYIDLSKAPETFTIDPTKDNTLTGKQGTTILIPSNTVKATNNTITVAIQEYYDYQQNTANAGMLKYTFYDGETQLTVSNENNVQVYLKNLTNTKQLKVMRSSDAMPDAIFKKMQWATNEKFVTVPTAKTNVKVQLPKAYNANTFMSQLAFVNHNTIIAGDIVNNSIEFKNVPIGETVFFTSIGKINDKYFSCSKKIITSNNTNDELNFVEISEELYKKQLDELGKLGQ